MQWGLVSIDWVLEGGLALSISLIMVTGVGGGLTTGMMLNSASPLPIQSSDLGIISGTGIGSVSMAASATEVGTGSGTGSEIGGSGYFTLQQQIESICIGVWLGMLLFTTNVINDPNAPAPDLVSSSE